jgi:hypothetical protein
MRMLKWITKQSEQVIKKNEVTVPEEVDEVKRACLKRVIFKIMIKDFNIFLY